MACRMLGYFAEQQGDYEQALGLLPALPGQLPRCAVVAVVVAEALCFMGTTYLDISAALLDRVADFHGRPCACWSSPAAP